MTRNNSFYKKINKTCGLDQKKLTNRIMMMMIWCLMIQLWRQNKRKHLSHAVQQTVAIDRQVCYHLSPDVHTEFVDSQPT